MPNRVTIESKNRYRQSRLKAAKYNEKLLTRSGAADFLPGVTEDSLKKYELGINRPPNTVVALMADAYAEPELRSWYCANECPLGKDRVAEIDDMPPERTTIRMQRQLTVVQDALEEFAGIVEDGIITPDELERVPEIKKQFLQTRQKVDEMLAAIEKIESRKGYPAE
ncbi:MAG: XRE family transcriptional regulator [Lachnospiraceae bacterium]|nr:XRE family transcriptional regulator [Lachnospiraceae bacterium]